jgi:hypothetical protein
LWQNRLYDRKRILLADRLAFGRVSLRRGDRAIANIGGAPTQERSTSTVNSAFSSG